MVHYFVWYRVRAEPGDAPGNDSPPFRRAVDAVLADVHRATGIRGTLLRRREQSDTWMEVYEAVAEPGAFEHELATAVARHGLAEYMHESGRHVEAFVDGDDVVDLVPRDVAIAPTRKPDR